MITFIDYGRMPDLDGRIDYLGLQYTISYTRELSAEIVIFLHNLKLLYKSLAVGDDISNFKKENIKGYITADNINTFDMKNLDFDYVIITSNDDVKISKRKAKDMTKFPPYIIELIPSLKCFTDNELLCDNIIAEVNKKKHIVKQNF